MTHRLSAKGYAHTKRRLASLEARLAAIRERKDLQASHLAAVIRSYEDVMRQYLREIKLYEASHHMPLTQSPGQSDE